jgi:hypothetical protein
VISSNRHALVAVARRAAVGSCIGAVRKTQYTPQWSTAKVCVHGYSTLRDFHFPCLNFSSRRPPYSLPIFGNAIKFLQPRHILFDWFVQCQQTFGFETYEISVPSLPPGVVIQDPRNLEFVLKNEKNFTKGEFFRRRSWDLFGTPFVRERYRALPLTCRGHGIINADGELWKAQRKAGLSFFSGTSLERFIETVLPEAFALTKATLLDCALSGSEIDLQDLFLGLTTKAVGRMAYNVSDLRTNSSTSSANTGPCC